MFARVLGWGYSNVICLMISSLHSEAFQCGGMPREPCRLWELPMCPKLYAPWQSASIHFGFSFLFEIIFGVNVFTIPAVTKQNSMLTIFHCTFWNDCSDAIAQSTSF